MSLIFLIIIIDFKIRINANKTRNYVQNENFQDPWPSVGAFLWHFIRIGGLLFNMWLCHIWDGIYAGSKSWPAPTLGESVPRNLRRFKVPSAVVYALFILVIYSHAVLARQQFTLRRSYLKVAGRECCPDPPTAWDRVAGFPSAAPDNGQRGKVGKETGDDAGEKEGGSRRARSGGESHPGRASFRVRSRRHLWTVGAEYKKSRWVPEVYSRRILYDS